MLPSQSTSQRTSIRFPSFGKRIIPRIEIFALGKLLRQEVLFIGKLAISAEEIGFLFCQLLQGPRRLAIQPLGSGYCKRNHTLMSTLFFLCGLRAIAAEDLS